MRRERRAFQKLLLTKKYIKGIKIKEANYTLTAKSCQLKSAHAAA